MQIRTFEEKDTDAVVSLWQACGLTRPWNDPHADIARATADARRSTLLVGTDDAGAIIASVMVGYDGHRGWVYYLATDPAHQRQGYGRAMIAAAEDWLKAMGAPKIQLMVRDDNSAAHGFYAALGYERQPVATFGKRFTE